MNQTEQLETCGRRGSGGCSSASEERLEFPPDTIVEVSKASAKATMLWPFAVPETRQ